MSTAIDWPGLTDTLNPLGWGCYGPGGEKCEYCYAAEMAQKAREGKSLIKVKCQQCLDFVPHYHPERLKGFTGKKPKKIFMQSMGDLFGSWVDRNFIAAVIWFCQHRPQHTFMFLTKNPQRYEEFVFPKNCWLGTTITCYPYEYKDEFDRNYHMVKQYENKTFLSLEPIYGSNDHLNFGHYDMIIVGADSRKGAPPPKREWVDSIKHHNIYYKNNIIKHFPDLICDTSK